MAWSVFRNAVLTELKSDAYSFWLQISSIPFHHSVRKKTTNPERIKMMTLLGILRITDLHHTNSYIIVQNTIIVHLALFNAKCFITTDVMRCLGRFFFTFASKCVGVFECGSQHIF